MNIRPTPLLLLTLLNILFGAVSAQAQDDVYLVNSERLFRWASQQGRRNLPPQSLQSPAGIARIASIAINRRNVAYLNTGLDGAIYRTDGQTATRVYMHGGQVRQLAFGRSDDILFFSVVPTPQGNSALPDGQLYALNLSTGQAVLRHTIAQSTVDGAWWGALTVDPEDRILLGTFSGGIYEMRSGRPALAYREVGNKIYGLTMELNALFYTTGGSQVYKLRNFRDRQLILNIPGGKLTHVSYASLPLSSEPQEPCELVVNLTGGDPGLMNLFSPALRGPNLHWISADVTGNGGRVAPDRFRYFVGRGSYWVRMDTRGDIGRAPRPREHKVACTGAGGSLVPILTGLNP